MLIRRIALPVLATALIAAATAAPASAGKADPSSCSTPTLSGDAQRHVGDVYTVAGCGFAPGALVPLEIGEADGCCSALNVLADSSGRLLSTSTSTRPCPEDMPGY